MNAGDGEPDPRSGPVSAVRWFLSTEHEGVVFVREMLESALAVLVVGAVLFAASGVWPPMVAVESGSMEPHMTRGDLVFVMDEGRLVPDAAHADTGVVTYRTAEDVGYAKFGDYGDVLIYRPDGSGFETPIIHRARFWVDEGENWYDEANERYVSADSCEELSNCPAPHAGFITKGDANRYYDQAQGISSPVRQSWIRGTAEIRIPWLGHVRLLFSSTAPVPATTVTGPASATNIHESASATSVAASTPATVSPSVA
jgi:signal peptidase